MQTVLGPVAPESLGPTMVHEHLVVDLTCMFSPPSEATELGRAYAPIMLETIGWIRYHFFSHRENLLLVDEETAIAEASLYKHAGGRTLVDVTTIGIGRDPLALARIARATGLNIVMGAGYYVDATHPPELDRLSEAEVAQRIVRDIRHGVDSTDVQAGIIGEIGCSWPLTANERKVLRATAAAQQETGAAISIHPGRSEDAPRETLEILAGAGADLGRAITGHLELRVADFGKLLEIAASGCYLAFDLFGHESSYYPLSELDMPSDAQRIRIVKRLLDHGVGRIVLSQDICSKHRLVRYGGHGYGHLLANIVPRMREAGIGDDALQKMLVENPAGVLTLT